MTTLSQLRTRVRERADMVGSTFVSDSELNNWINLGYAELYDIVTNAYEDYFTTSTTLTISSGNTVALPAAFYKLRGLDFSLNGRWVEVRQYEFNERNLAGSGGWLWADTLARQYRLVGDNLSIVPEDNALGSYRLWYVPAYTVLSADGDSIPTSLSKFGWDEYIVLWAAEKALSKEESSVTDVNNERALIAQRIAQMAANRQVAQSDCIQDVTGMRPFGGWYVP